VPLRSVSRIFAPTLVVAAMLALAAPLQAQTPSPMADSLAHARRITQWFFTAQADSLIQFVPPADRDKMSKEAILQRVGELTARVGTETEVVEEKFVKRNGQTQYWRTSKYSLASEPIMVRWVLSPKGEILGMGMNPASQAPPIDP
jgi:hypothetical protein